MKRIWQLLGVEESDPVGLMDCRPQSSKDTPLVDSIQNYDEMEFAYRHDIRLSEYLDDAPNHKLVGRSLSSTPIPLSELTILPVFENKVTTTQESPSKPVLLFGVDDDDEVYNNSDNSLLRSLFEKDFQVELVTLSGLQGKICKIWSRLATYAYTKLDADFTCLMGDDIELHDTSWQDTIESHFAQISETKKLPFGAACVAFRDLSFPGFPTFPVIHKWHFHALGGEIFPSQFDYQGGDPFLFELYKRFGASHFALETSLENTIGGKADARYTKQRLRFEDDILTKAIRQIATQLRTEGYSGVTTRCMDIVVPTFRCDILGLERITKLRASWAAQISFWIVLDNPDHPFAPQVRALQTVAQNYQIRVLEQRDRFGKPRNYGASAARNYGLAHSNADHAILLDDDVLPEKSLLDACLGAAMRWPNASVLVGSTHFPHSHNLLTNAIVASDIPGAYTIAKRTREPTWGVTANLCIQARTSRLRFDLADPKAGGGEDLDYCARARRYGPIKAVPGAKALHPWWYDGEWRAIGQILGWAAGEVRCIAMPELREHVFWTAPNGVEMAILLFLLPILFESNLGLGLAISKSFIYSFSVICLETIWHVSGIGPHRLRGEAKRSFLVASRVRFIAAILIMMQETTRFVRALQQSPTLLFWLVDWHFGQNPYWLAKKKRNSALRACCYGLLFFG